MSVAIRTDELVKAVRNFPWPAEISEPERMENPYYFAFKAITELVAQAQETDFGICEPIDFIFDEESEKARTIAGWDWIKLFADPNIRKYMGDTPSYKNDAKVLPLQGADLYAWWVRKWVKDGAADWLKELPFPWGIKRSIRRIHIEFGEKDFLRELERFKQPEILARMRISDPKAALKVKERRERGVKMTLPDPSSPFMWRV